jgi:hypothetical protein
VKTFRPLQLTVGLTLLGAFGCAAAPLPAPVSQANAVSESKAASDAKVFAPQAHAAAEKLRAEAKWLHGEGRLDEAAAAGEQAIAAYNEAFALARAAQAEERIEAARKGKEAAAADLAELDRLQSQVAADADAFEMRARVHLDKEEVKDVESLTPERAKARRYAAKQLAAEGHLLCLASRLLDAEAIGLKEAQATITTLEKELGFGSVKDDLYPRAAAGRAACLKLLTSARRPAIKKAPESAASDRLFSSLTKTGAVFAFRDDRGIVVNLGSPVDKKGELKEATEKALTLLGGTSKAHPDFPLLLVAHTAKSTESKRAKKMTESALAALTAAGAKKVTTHAVLGAQPVVSASLRGAAEKNERLEVVFVVPGR